MGLKTFATLSTTDEIDHPRFFGKEEKALAQAQCRLCKAEKGPPKRKTRRKVVARVHRQVVMLSDNHQQGSGTDSLARIYLSTEFSTTFLASADTTLSKRIPYKRSKR